MSNFEDKQKDLSKTTQELKPLVDRAAGQSVDSVELISEGNAEKEMLKGICETSYNSSTLHKLGNLVFPGTKEKYLKKCEARNRDHVSSLAATAGGIAVHSNPNCKVYFNDIEVSQYNELEQEIPESVEIAKKVLSYHEGAHCRADNAKPGPYMHSPAQDQNKHSEIAMQYRELHATTVSALLVFKDYYKDEEKFAEAKAHLELGSELVKLEISASFAQSQFRLLEKEAYKDLSKLSTEKLDQMASKIRGDKISFDQLSDEEIFKLAKKISIGYLKKASANPSILK